MGFPQNLKTGDTIKVRILETDKADPPAKSSPSANKAQMDAMKKKSRRHYLPSVTRYPWKLEPAGRPFADQSPRAPRRTGERP